MNRYVYILTFVSLLVASCSSDDYLGNKEDINGDTPVSFGGETGKMTRAYQVGAIAAGTLNNSFVVYGYKTTNDVKSTVLDYYSMHYSDGTAHTTLSNTDGWEYVGFAPNMLTSLPYSSVQSIKYWDFGASTYDFVAFSVAGTSTQVKTKDESSTAGKLYVSPLNQEYLTSAAYTVEGSTNDIVNLFFSDRVTADKTVEPGDKKPYTLIGFRDNVRFCFHPLASKIRIGLYETVPGYSVKDVKFYSQPVNPTISAVPYLYAGLQTIPSGSGGKVTISFPIDNSAQPDYNKAVAAYEGNKVQNLQLGSAISYPASPEYIETAGNYLGRSSNDASMSSDVLVVPAPANELTLKIDFTLVSIDYNETIEMKGVVATVPADFTNWQAGYAYTYLFKISDAVSDASGQLLYPVTFDALETMDDEGMQQTITTIDVPSITTYAKGAVSDDYYVGDNIYVSVADNAGTKTLSDSNSKLYTVSLGDGLHDSDVTEINIKGNKDGITLNAVTPGFMSFVTSISAEDSPTGAAISGNFAKFTAGSDIYVFEYKVSAEEKHYKVIRVGNARRPLILPDIPEEDI